jgi:aspartate racemase
MSDASRTGHIGIVACSAEGAALCYRTIAQYSEQFLGAWNHPTITMHSIALARWMDAFSKGDYAQIAARLSESVRIVAAAGADFAVCPDNSCHLAWENIIGESPIPWLHIAEVVADEAQRQRFQRAGLLGTRFTMNGPVYSDIFRRFDVDVVTPSESDQSTVDSIIWTELVRGVFREESLDRYLRVIENLKIAGCDCVILGCTEIPLLVTPDVSPLPVLDSTRLLAKAAVNRAIGRRAHSLSRDHNQ